MKLREELYHLPFDQFSRQYRVMQFIDKLRPTARTKFTILDVGGYKGKTPEFQTKDAVTVCDLVESDEPHYVRVNGTDLPFKEGSFDITVSFDAYEHVPRPQRAQFLSEIIRVSKQVSIIAAPFDNEKNEVHKAEQRLNQYHSELYGQDHRWLKEHIDYQVPICKEFESLLKKHKLSFVALPSNDRVLWELLQTLYFSVELDRDLWERASELNWIYNNHIDALDTTPPERAYRWIYIISRKADTLTPVKKFIATLPEQDVQFVEQFTARLIHIFGLKYRDVVHHRNYLEQEVLGAREREKEHHTIAERYGELRAILRDVRRLRVMKAFKSLKRAEKKRGEKL